MRSNLPSDTFISSQIAISEMAVVDTFTRLIFSDSGPFTPMENTIIEAFRTIDANVLMDDPEDMGQYLRTLGVSEMIHLVSRIRDHLSDGRSAAAPEIGVGAQFGANSTRRVD